MLQKLKATAAADDGPFLDGRISVSAVRGHKLHDIDAASRHESRSPQDCTVHSAEKQDFCVDTRCRFVQDDVLVIEHLPGLVSEALDDAEETGDLQRWAALIQACRAACCDGVCLW